MENPMSKTREKIILLYINLILAFILVVLSAMMSAYGMRLIYLDLMFEFGQDENFKHMGAMMVFIGLCMFIIVLTSTVSIRKEIVSGLVLYGAALILIVVVQVASLSLFVGTWRDASDSGMYNSLQHYNVSNFERRFWDHEQKKGCCGVLGPEDWKVLPESCCSPAASHKVELHPLCEAFMYKYLNTRGCAAKIRQEQQLFSKVIVCIFVPFIGFELLGSGFTAWFASVIKKENYS